jgi:hypothetical protein
MAEIPGQLPLWEEAVLPWGKPALVEIPEPFWSTDWLNGVRSKTYLGEICWHYDQTQGNVCVQPLPQQGVQQKCAPFDPETAKIRVLPGRLGDYT